MTNKPDLKDVLAVVNRGRAVLGFQPLEEMPKGKPGSCRYCPLALAFDTKVEKHYIALDEHQTEFYEALTAALAPEEPWSLTSYHGLYRHVKLPDILQYFAHFFDMREYPELIV